MGVKASRAIKTVVSKKELQPLIQSSSKSCLEHHIEIGKDAESVELTEFVEIIISKDKDGKNNRFLPAKALVSQSQVFGEMLEKSFNRQIDLSDYPSEVTLTFLHFFEKEGEQKDCDAWHLTPNRLKQFWACMQLAHSYKCVNIEKKCENLISNLAFSNPADIAQGLVQIKSIISKTPSVFLSYQYEKLLMLVLNKKKDNCISKCYDDLRPGAPGRPFLNVTHTCCLCFETKKKTYLHLPFGQVLSVGARALCITARGDEKDQYTAFCCEHHTAEDVKVRIKLGLWVKDFDAEAVFDQMILSLPVDIKADLVDYFVQQRYQFKS